MQPFEFVVVISLLVLIASSGLIVAILHNLNEKLHHISKKVNILLDCISSFDEEDAKNTEELNRTTLEVFKMLKDKYSTDDGSS